MTGPTKTTQTGWLDDATNGLGRTLYLALYKWTGTAGQGVGVEPNDDGTLPTNLVEVSGGGYARKSVASTDWSTVAAGALGTASSKQLPKSGGSAISWTASGAAYGEVCAWALLTASSGGTMAFSGFLCDSAGTPIKRDISDGDTLTIDDSNPILVRVGDPPKVADASSGTQRVVPT